MLLKSERLRRIARYVQKDAPMADIGTDHALLPCYLVMNESIPRAIAVEVNRGPYEAARRQVEASGLGDSVDVRLGDGLTALEPGEVHTVVIAGMGGKLIDDILSNGKHVVRETGRLVLQPNVAASRLRQWMLNEGWRLVEEDLVFENDLFYEILVAEPGSPYAPYDSVDDNIETKRLMEVGPLLWRNQHPLLRLKLEREIEKRERILQQLHTSQQPEVTKRAQFEQQIQDWKEMTACLPRESTSSAFSND